jgi:hypothetical protein
MSHLKRCVYSEFLIRNIYNTRFLKPRGGRCAMLSAVWDRAMTMPESDGRIKARAACLTKP